MNSETITQKRNDAVAAFRAAERRYRVLSEQRRELDAELRQVAVSARIAFNEMQRAHAVMIALNGWETYVD